MSDYAEGIKALKVIVRRGPVVVTVAEAAAVLSRVAELEGAHEAMREALEFYAKGETWQNVKTAIPDVPPDFTGDMDDWTFGRTGVNRITIMEAAARDKGTKARAALSAVDKGLQQ